MQNFFFVHIVRCHVDAFICNSTTVQHKWLFLKARYLRLSTYPTESRQIPLLTVNAVQEDFLKATSNLYHLTHVVASFFSSC